MEANIQQIIAWLGAAWVRSAAYNWLLRQGVAQWLAHGLALIVGGVVKRAIATA
ncbi:hypothetical protein [Actinomadura darangshiensis]|uniref:hypothetical protein n=1 Tax=Actinomadura darangshiensis TaxID=705336 RepID=UPI00140E00CC|nr:hypothetical protein [Actinomadura darangshiensis]